MYNQQDIILLLDDALLRAIPESGAWVRVRTSARSDEPQYWIEVRSPLRPSTQHLNILLRHDGEIQIEYHFTVKSGSPFEMLIPLVAGRELAGIEEATLFVADLLAERLVLVHTKGVFRGGRRFLNPCSLTESARRDLSWITSWLGNFDYPNPT
jgi:hypothetical protein